MKKAFSLIAVATLSLTLAAQDFKTGYFLDNYVYGYRLNPALTPEENSSSFTGILIGDMTYSPLTNVGLSQFLFNKDGSLVWGFNDKVSESEFLGGLPDPIKGGFKMDMGLLSIGFNTKVGFFTIDARLRGNVQTNLSKSVLGYAKEGFDTKPGAVYKIPQLSLGTQEYLELAIGYSRRIESFKIGATLKVLAGVASAEANLRDINVVINDNNSATFSGQTDIALASSLISLPKTSDGYYDFKNIGIGSMGVSGFGAAVDLGVHWDAPVDGLSVDAAILDLGAMSSGNTIKASASFSNQKIEVSSDNTNEILSKLFGISANMPAANNLKMLSATINAGARYKMPFYQRLSVGAHGSFSTGTFSSYDLRVGATVTPINAISIAVNGGTTSLGGVVGAAINFRLGPIALFAGVDNLISLTRFSPQGYPLNKIDTAVKFGLTIAPKAKK